MSDCRHEHWDHRRYKTHGMNNTGFIYLKCRGCGVEKIK
jgi:ribosomal protein S27E